MSALHKTVAFLFLTVHVIAVAQTPGWTQFQNSPPGTTRNDDIYFTDLTNGWSARGIDGIYRTTNSGNTWIKVNSNTNPVAHFRCIGFASPTRGWAGNLGPGSYDVNVTDTNMLYETFTGGASWNVVPAINASGMAGFCAMHVLDTQRIYGVGRVRGPAYFAKSENSGTSWWITNLTAAGIMGGLMDVHFKDATNGFVVGMDANPYTNNCSFANYHGAIARTTNGGLTWQVVANTPVNCSYFWKMSWPSPNVGYASLQQNGSYNTVIYFKTTDGGATWSSNGIPLASIGAASFALQGIGFVSTNEGWMGGSSSTSLPFNQNFIHTTNGGLSWTTEGYDNTRGMNRIRFASPTLGYGAGQKLHVFCVPLNASIQPTNQTVTVGSNAVFNATVQGTPPLNYQWRFNGANISNATNVSLTLTTVLATNAGNYDIVASDFSGSVTSAVAGLSVVAAPSPPSITTQPQSVTVFPASNATFTVTATGVPPLRYQWRFNNANLSGATNSSYTRINSQPADVGNYTVVVTNNGGSVTSAVATLSLALFLDDFDGYASPVTVTNIGTTNGYKVFFNANSGGLDFKVVFGFDYSTVTYPTNIPPAPFSSGTTKGLFLTVNKDTNAQIAAVNLYPVGQTNNGNFALKFDLWLNYSGINSTEHALFGINHSGNITNRVSLNSSDGLFFAVDGDGGASPTGNLRDYSAFRGGGSGNPPILMTTNITTFGPTPLLSPQFDAGNPGITALFPAKSIPGWGNTPAGACAMGWVRGEVRQVNNLVTCLLNGVAIAQYTNTFPYTNGSILIGYNDHFPSIGELTHFAIFDNIRVEPITLAPVTLLSPHVVGTNFNFSFATEPYESYTVLRATNLVAPVWLAQTNLVGNGGTMIFSLPLPGNSAAQYFRVSRP